MPITNRELAPGAILTGTLKKIVYKAEVVETPDGIRYRVNGKDFKSPSAAGSAVMNGVAHGNAPEEALVLNRECKRAL